MKFFFILFLGAALSFTTSAEAKVDKDKCHKLAKRFDIIGSESEPGNESQRLSDFLRSAQSGSEKDKERNKTQFCAMFFAQVNFIEANYKEMRDEKCDSFEQYNITWRTSSDYLQNRFKPQVDLLCKGGNKPGFGSTRAFNIAYDDYIKFYGKMLGENKAIEKSSFKFW